MMHRLHFQEAQQSSYAITPARTDSEIKDDSESESLAAEFQGLLAQLTGQIASLPDQMTALGFALAQTIATQHLRPKEDPAANHQEQAVEDRGEDRGIDYNSGANNSSTDVVDSRAGERQERQLATNGSKDDEVEDQVVNTQVKTVESTEVAQDLSQVVQEIIAQKSAELVPDQVNSDAVADAGVSAQVVVSDSNADDKTGLLEARDLSRFDNQVAVVEQHVEGIQVAVKRDLQQQVNDEEVEEDQFAQSVAVAVEDSDNTATNRKILAAVNHRDAKADGELPSAGAQVSETQNQLDNRGYSSTDTSEQGAPKFEESGLERQQRAGEGSKKLNFKELDSSEIDNSFAAPAPESRRSDVGSQTNIQMALLRQAFESVRALRGNSNDTSGFRPQAQSIQAAGAAVETKAAQGEQSTKGRPLTRPQVTRMLERVETTLKEAARGRDGKTISLHLEPVDLGKVKVDVSLREGTLHARISPDNQQVAQSLREHAHELQSALRKLGLEVDSVTVSVNVDDFSREMTTGQEMLDGRSFQDERHNMPQDRAQVLDNTVGNELAERSKANATSERSGSGSVTDHWIA
jgi:flagellar hook-length control protein FliK